MNLSSDTKKDNSLVVAFIPARAGSKGIPGKNKKLFCGKPLVQWSIDQAKAAGIFDEIVVSSDDEDILNMAKQSQVTAIRRADELCDDEASLDAVLYDYFFNHKGDYICLLQPTSPLRSVDDITESYKEICKDEYVSVVGVTWNPIMAWVEKANSKGPICFYLIDKRPNRQSRDDWYLENGAIYWMKRKILIDSGNRIGNSLESKLYHMPYERSLEVDTLYDWFIAEKTLDYIGGSANEQQSI